MPLSDLQAFTDHSIASGRGISWSLNGNWTLFQTWIWKLRSCRFFLLFIVLSLLVLPLTDGLTKVNVSEFVTRLTTDWTNMYRWFQFVDVLLCCLGDGRILSCNSYSPSIGEERSPDFPLKNNYLPRSSFVWSGCYKVWSDWKENLLLSKTTCVELTMSFMKF